MKHVILLSGSNGSGKTTQSRLLIKALADDEIGQPRQNKEGEKPWMYTAYPEGRLAVLGKMGSNQCTGLDAVYGNLGADGVTLSLKRALEDEDVEIIIVDCIFATISWYKKWQAANLREKFKLIVVHFELTLWENFKRISQRQAVKLRAKGKEIDWWDVHLKDTVYKNVGSKNRETRNIYLKLIGQHPNAKQNCNPTANHFLQVKAVWKKQQIHQMIIQKLGQSLKSNG